MTDTRTATKLIGVWVLVGRTIWYALALIMGALFVYSVSTLPATLEAIQEETGPGLPLLFGSLSLLRRYIVTVMYYSGSILLFWRRSNDRIVLVASMMLLSMGSFPLATGLFDITSQIMEVPPFWDVVAVAVLGITLMIAMTVLLIYPDGRFTPPWSRWLLLAIAVLALAYSTTYYMRRSLPADHIPYITTFMVLAIWLQIKRYRQASSTQRQQVKWFIVGAVCYISFQIIAALFYSRAGGTDLGGGLLTVIAEIFFMTAYLGLFASLSMAVVRYRLWDIDFVINRSLVYGGLTLLLGALFLALFFAVQALVDTLFDTPQPVLAAIIGFAPVPFLYQPAYRRLRGFVDRSLYGIEIDYDELARQKAAQLLAAEQADSVDTFGSYSGLKPIGRGGMGVVYVATHRSTGEKVAMKLVRDAEQFNEKTIERFKREARTMIGLSHPNIVRLHEVGTIQDMPYITMEYISGQSLWDMLKERRQIPFDEALPILRDVAAALDYAHTHGIIHRDIKPGNVMIDSESPDRRAVLMDFGIARLDAATRLTKTDSLLGTLDYIAPEQIQGSEHVDHRSDLYSFGVMSYQMLTGELPFRHSNPGAIIMAHLMQPPPDPRQKVPDLSAPAAMAIMRAMAKDPTARFATAGEFIAAMGT